MKNLNNYIVEVWSGVKKHSNIEDIKSWCDEMGIKNYTINTQGEIDVNGNVNLSGKNFEELPYKFGRVNGWFSVGDNPKLISLKNCPYYTKYSFDCNMCKKLDSLEGCPKEVGWKFYCRGCKRIFTEEEVRSICKVKRDILRLDD